MPAIHASACSTSEAAGVPSTRSRTADTVTDTGWWRANTWSQLGIELTGTNADDAKTSGASTGNAAAWAVSGSPTARPTVANTHAITYPNARTSTIPATK